ADKWATYFESYQFGFNAWMEHQILGAPNVLLWTSAPGTFNVQYDFDEDYYSNFTVVVRDGQGNLVQDAKVSIYSAALEERSFAYTDAAGKATVPFTIKETAYGKITVTKENFKPFQVEIVLRDLTEPETTPACANPNPDGANGWYVSDPMLSLQCTEPADIYFKWNGDPVENYRGGTLLVPKGSNVLEYWAEDLSGNEEERKYFVIKYDPDTPVASVIIDPAEPDGEMGWYLTQPVITTDLQPSPGSPQRVDFWWGRDAKQVSNGTVYPPQGTSELHIQAVDEAGNKGEEKIYLLKVDSIVPRTKASTGGIEPNERGWYVSPMTITLTSDDRRSYIYYRWDGDEEFSKYSTTLTPLSGNNTLYYYSIDEHGNEEPERTMQVPYDIMPPDLEVTVTPMSPDGESRWYVTRPRVVLDVAFEDNEYTIYYYFDGEEPMEYLSPLNIPDGEWTLHSYAEDEAGNRGVLQTHAFKVDTSPDPTQKYIDVSENDEGWYTDLPQVILGTSEGSQIYYSWEGYTGYERYSGGLYPPGEEGVFTLKYYSVDPAGNLGSEKDLMLPVDCKAPVVALEAPRTAASGEEVLFDLSGTTDGVEVDAYHVDFGDGTDSGWVVSPKITHSYPSSGKYRIKVTARDEAGHESDELKWDLEVTGGSNLIIVLVAGGALVVLLLILAAAAVVIVHRNRHHHLAHHPVHIPPSYHLQGPPTTSTRHVPGTSPAAPLKQQVPPAKPGTSATPPEPAPPVKSPVDIPKPPVYPSIPEPPEPPA
ncbi:MAG: PKD domain-containing protein, partial [Candidatus Thermoplasmatota archaeon]|nr:PKD domain-containing protein [Candidatus Thermoplasmatota archaeon]